MKVNRALIVIGIALAVSTTVLAVRVVQLGNRLERAEYYAQGGIDSVSMVCGSVVRALNTEGDKTDVDPIARECLGWSPDVLEEFRRRDWARISALITAQIKARKLPYLAFEKVQPHLLPHGYLQDP